MNGVNVYDYPLIYQRISRKYLVFAGMDDLNNPFLSLKKALKDDKRINYHNDYLSNLSAAIRLASVL